MNPLPRLVCILSFALFALSVAGQTADWRVIPLPREITLSGGNGFLITPSTTIAYPEGNIELERCAAFLADYICTATGMQLRLTDAQTRTNAIVLTLADTTAHAESYRLCADEQQVTIASPTPAGIFRGIQTLRKSLPIGETSEVLLPAATINDAPRFDYRGAHFDNARHFFTVEETKQYIDMMALHNINYLHFHLTDNQGWRLEIPEYPRLIEVGSKRSFDGPDYGGFLTQEEARELVRYAQERYITIVPEIDLPSHMQAAIASYPELGCTGDTAQDVLCLGNDSTIAFIDHLLLTLIDIFPSPYIHIGGDECPRTFWEQCPKCQQRIESEGLRPRHHFTSEQRLQSWITQHAVNLLARHGRRLIGWDEILEGGLAEGATVMSWRGESGGLAAARMGHDAIMTPGEYLYFDHCQSADPSTEPRSQGGYLPVSKVYSYEPVPAKLSRSQAAHIIGLQSNLWTEYIKTFSHAQYMVLPRWAAMCEVQWCPKDTKDYADFLTRLPRLLAWYDALGYNYARHILAELE